MRRNEPSACYVCGHSIEEHTGARGNVSECRYDECECIHYEPEPEPEDDDEVPNAPR